MLARVEKIALSGTSSFYCLKRRDPKFEFSWHFHPEFELTFIVRSRGKRFVGDSIADYGDGDLVLLGPNLPHTWDSDPGSRRHEAVVVLFSESFLGPDFFKVPEMLRVRRLLERSAQGLRFTGRTQRIVALRLARMARLQGLPRLILFLQVLETLSGSRECRALSSKGFMPTLSRADRERIDRVCRFLDQRCTEEVSLPEAASLAHMSVSAFSRFFKRKTGKNFVAYLNELRLGLACRLLIETDKSVSEICFESGFQNLSNFNRRFLRLKGTSPRDYRRQFAVEVGA